MSASARKREDLSDRLIEMLRLIGAPQKLVYEAFHDPKHITNWWGPNGFSTTTYKMDFRVGGEWLFTMHGPDGTDYENRVRYTEINAPTYMAYDHDGGDGGQDVYRFKAEVMFEPEDGKTRVTLRLICQSVEQRETMAKFGAIEGGHQTLERLDHFIATA